MRGLTHREGTDSEGRDSDWTTGRGLNEGIDSQGGDWPTGRGLTHREGTDSEGRDSDWTTGRGLNEGIDPQGGDWPTGLTQREGTDP